MESITVTKKIPVVGHYDLVVAGAGPAGFIAAVAAARCGIRTAVVEQYGFAGGMATAGLVAPISVFNYNGALVIGGIPWEFVKRLEGMGGAIIEQPLNNIAFDTEVYKLCARRMLDEAKVDLYMHSYLSGCVCEDGKVTSVYFENKNGAEALTADMFIDATGDADLCHMAGVPMQPTDTAPLQPASLIFTLDGVDTDSELLKCMHHNLQGVNMHCLPMREKLSELKKTTDMPIFGGPWFCTLLRKGCVAVNMTRHLTDVCDNRDFSKAEQILREDAFRFADILRANFTEFANCRLSGTAVQAGPRESRRILGAHVITSNEYLNAFQYEDSVSRGAHPIDIHTVEGEKQTCHFLEKPAYVPYRALYAKGFSNLLAAGRCISADKQAFASLRVQASAMGIGQAAGVAAARCLKDHVSVEKADVSSIIAALRKMGAVI